MASRRKRHGFVYDDLPESENIEDRRGEPPPRKMTLTEMAEQAKRRKKTELGQPDPTSQLAQDLGVDDIEGRG